MKNKKYHTVRTILKYYTVGTILKYYTVRTILKYYTVRTILKYHTVRTILKYHTVRTIPNSNIKLISITHKYMTTYLPGLLQTLFWFILEIRPIYIIFFNSRAIQRYISFKSFKELIDTHENLAVTFCCIIYFEQEIHSNLLIKLNIYSVHC